MKKLYFLLGFLWVCGLPYSHAQIISTIAGNGVSGYGGDGGPATLAMLNNPIGTNVDSVGNLYVADNSAHVRKITPAGIITTIAGNGTLVHSGDGGLATAAGIEYARDMIMDKRGDIYIAEANPVNLDIAYIRKIDTTGIISTIAGNGLAGFAGDGGPATAASFRGIRYIKQDKVGNIYFADNGNNRIRKIDTSGTITTIAGTGTPAFSGDGGPATAAELNGPVGIAIDDSENIYFSDAVNNCIRKINTTGIINTIAGTILSPGFSGDGGPATAAKFNSVGSLCIDNKENLFATDFANRRIRKIDTAGIITTYAGDGFTGHTGDCGPAIAANIGNPAGVSVDRSGNIYFAEAANQYIRKVYAPGTTDIVGPNNICTGVSLFLIDSTPDGKWQSNNTAIASIDSVSGHLLGVSSGIAIITYFFTGCYVTDSMTVNTSPYIGAITGIDSICIGDTVHLHDTVTGGIWGSSSSILAMITTAGIATGLTPGMDTISYTVTAGSCSSAATFRLFIRQQSECPNKVAVTNADNTTFNVYPNPNNGAFSLLLTSGVDEEVRVVVSNVVGEKVKEITTATNNNATIKLDTPAGLYFINAATKDASYNAKIILVK